MPCFCGARGWVTQRSLTKGNTPAHHVFQRASEWQIAHIFHSCPPLRRQAFESSAGCPAREVAEEGEYFDEERARYKTLVENR